MDRGARGVHFTLEFLEVFHVGTVTHARRIQHAHRLQDQLVVLVSLQEDLERTEWLPLVASLVNNSIQGCQVGRVLCVCENLLFRDFLPHLLEISHLK